MPDYVLKNKHGGVGPWVLSLPTGATDEDLKAALAVHEAGGWSLDKQHDPQDVAASQEAGLVEAAAAAPNSTPKGK